MTDIPPVTISFTAKSICEIIRTCKLSGVKRFFLGGLEITFLEDGSPLVQHIPRLEEKVEVKTPAPLEELMRENEKIELDKQEMSMDQLMIEDPVAYEEFLSQEREAQN